MINPPTNHKYADYSKDGFPWEAYSWILKEYGHYLKKSNLSKIIGFDSRETTKFIKLSGIQSVPSTTGHGIRYRFIDLPRLFEAYEIAQMEKLSKL